MNVIVRTATQDDMPFIYSSWLNHQRHTFPNVIVPGRMYYKGETYRLDKLLEKTQVFVACTSEDQNQILAWVCATTAPTLIVHYAFTKPTFRRLKIFTSILQLISDEIFKSDIPITRISKEALSFNILHKFKFVFNPYLEEKIIRL